MSAELGVCPRKRRLPPIFSSTFVREWRVYRGISLVNLAKKMGTTHATLSRIETGRATLGHIMLDKLSATLGVSRGDLLDNPPPKQKTKKNGARRK